MRDRFRRGVALASLTTALLPHAAWAHEGHGLETTLQGLTHWLSSPYHVAGLVTLLGLGIAVGLVAALRRRGASLLSGRERSL